jgi:hypothetical protein
LVLLALAEINRRPSGRALQGSGSAPLESIETMLDEYWPGTMPIRIFI